MCCQGQVREQRIDIAPILARSCLAIRSPRLYLTGVAQFDSVVADNRHAGRRRWRARARAAAARVLHAAAARGCRGRYPELAWPVCALICMRAIHSKVKRGIDGRYFCFWQRQPATTIVSASSRMPAAVITTAVPPSLFARARASISAQLSHRAHWYDAGCSARYRAARGAWYRLVTVYTDQF